MTVFELPSLFRTSESTAMNDLEGAVQILKELRKLGITVALDDFGTGYSPLTYLIKLPIDTLKIDRSFISNITADSDRAVVVESILTMAKKVNLKVVAEGVETKKDLDYLCNLGCDIGQGYYFSQPLPIVEFEQYLDKKILVK